jgi:hypothetical protein
MNAEYHVEKRKDAVCGISAKVDDCLKSGFVYLLSCESAGICPNEHILYFKLI